MESSSNKRKPKLISDDDDNEETKIEKFFSLIKGIKEARDRLMMNGSDAILKQEKKKKRKLEGEENNEQQVQVKVSAWNPCFQPEDFWEEYSLQAKNPRSAAMAETCQRNEVVPEKEENKDGLDLRLSL